MIKKTAILLISFALFWGCAGSPRLSKDDTALLVIDIQNAYLPVYNQSVFIANVSSILEKARETGIPVIHIRNIDGYNKEGSRGWKFHEAVRPIEGEIVVEKENPSSFTHTELEAILQKLGIKTLVLTGLASGGCYGATVRDSHHLGFNTIVVSDAHSDRTRFRADNLNKVLANYENILIMETEFVTFSNK